MPLYICNARAGLLSDEAKAKIAADITAIHCDVTAAPPTFVHAFFFEDALHTPLAGHSAVIHGRIRGGRTDAQKAEIASRMQQSVHQHAGIALSDIAVSTSDTPASWVMEGGDLLPEPGEEEAWLVAHERKKSAADRV